jgi:hypothetical protein
MKLVLSLILLLNFSFAQETTQKEIDYKESVTTIETIIQNDVGAEQTCLDEYILREQQLKKWMLWAPPLGVVATPVVTITTAASAALITNIVGVQGWAQLGWFIGGGMIGFGAGVLGTLGVTTVSAVKFMNNRNMLKLVVESHQDAEDFPYKKLNKYFAKYKKAWPNDGVELETFKLAIRNYDETSALCDGSLRATDINDKLKYRIARKWDIFNQIHADFGN